MFLELEGDAEHLITSASLDPDRPIDVGRLVAHHLGSRPQRAPHMCRESELAVVHGQPTIYVRSRIMPTRAKWLACHELAHWWLAKSGQEDPCYAEDQANALGAMLVAPGRAVSQLVCRFGYDPIGIAEQLRTTQSVALLRLGETRHAPSALVARHRILLRGEDYIWPSETVLRRARRQEVDGLQRVAVSDEPGRVGLLAVE